MDGSVWKVVLPNEFFGDYYPYIEEVFGDWLVTVDQKRHLGDVYLNGMSFYEADSLEELKAPELRTEVLDHRTERMVPVPNQQQTTYLWYAQTDDTNTTIYANFQGADPNEECVEINVRKACFYPELTGIDHL